MSEKCGTCGQFLPVDESFDFALETSCDSISKWYTGWDAVWQSWSVGELKVIQGKTVSKVSETDSDELDGYSTIPIEMVFEVNYGQYYKLSGRWSSYDGKKWDKKLVEVEKRERTAFYYD